MPSQGQDLQIAFDEIREKNLELVKLMNSVIFPLKFPVRVGRRALGGSGREQVHGTTVPWRHARGRGAPGLLQLMMPQHARLHGTMH